MGKLSALDLHCGGRMICRWGMESPDRRIQLATATAVVKWSIGCHQADSEAAYCGWHRAGRCHKIVSGQTIRSYDGTRVWVSTTLREGSQTASAGRVGEVLACPSQWRSHLKHSSRPSPWPECGLS